MAAKKPTKKATRRRLTRSKKIVKPEFKSKFISFLFKTLFSLIVLASLGCLYLDTYIRHQFEGKRWALPAKVYARPLELYAGSPLSLDELKIELRGLGYQFVKKVRLPGQDEFSASKAIISTRGFQFPDSFEPAQHLILQFSNSTLSNISNYQGMSLALVRLEPVLIGGIYPLNNEDRDLIQLSETPQGLTDALIAIEDRDFYNHLGISLKGISRAMVANIRAGRFVQGGSTLTQQLIKNFYLTSDKSLARKLLEIPMALLLELHYSKDEILEAYLNEVYLGQEGARAIHGFGLAAQYYFAQPIQELKLHQLALLAGLVKGASYYNPRRHPERAKKRRDLVLRVLKDQSSITVQQYQQAVNSKLGVVKQTSLLKGAYPAYLDLVKRQLQKNYNNDDLSSEGLRIFTSLNPIAQNKAESALVGTINRLEKQYGKKVNNLQGSMVVTAPQTGEVIAIVGGKNTRYQGFNRALDSARPVGSLIEQGYTLASTLDDSPYSLTMKDGHVWQPKNFDNKSHGDVQLHTALTKSYNIPAARLGMSLGLDKVLDTLRRLGVSKSLKPYPSLLLGAQGLSPLELAGMYQTIAANGFQIPLRAIRIVTDSTGQELSRYPFRLQQTIDPNSIHLLQYMLQEVTRSGTARSIYNQLPTTMSTAGKTGTSNDQRDTWFAGFTDNRLAVVWLGRDDNAPLPFTSTRGALQAWIAYMKSETLESFIAATPKDIEYHWIDQQNGLRSAELCDNAQKMPFLIGTAPTETTACASKKEQPISKSIDWIKQWF